MTTLWSSVYPHLSALVLACIYHVQCRGAWHNASVGLCSSHVVRRSTWAKLLPYTESMLCLFATYHWICPPSQIPFSVSTMLYFLCRILYLIFHIGSISVDQSMCWICVIVCSSCSAPPCFIALFEPLARNLCDDSSGPMACCCFVVSYRVGLAKVDIGPHLVFLWWVKN